MDNVRHIEIYLSIFGYILADSNIFRVLAKLDIFMYVKSYSEPMTYSGVFRTVDIFTLFQTLLRSISCIFWILIEQIETYLEPWLIWTRNVSRIFRHIHKGTHTEAYLPILGFSHNQDPAIIGSNNVKQHLLFKSGYSFKSLFRSFWNIFPLF